ncbi:MAG: metal ABC transporter solute-binding protein, Zn/Mn family [Phycisphaerales bacterium]
MRRFVTLLAIGVSALFLGARPAPAEPGFTVVCTIGQIADITRQVAGDRAEVIGLLGPGVDPHLYKLTRSDVGQLRAADLVFYNGLLLEGKMIDALVRLASSGKPVHAVTESIDEENLLTPEAFAGAYDPHVWMDPQAWAKAVEQVRDRLIAFDPAGEAAYRGNAGAYLDELAALDAYAERVLATVPADRRVLVTAHDAFNYFGRRFGFEVLGIQGISTESEAGVREIESLVNVLVERGIPAVFVETTVSQRNIKALIEGARSRGHEVVIGGSLFSDAMGAGGTYEGTYLGMLDHNVTTIAPALGGAPPARGWKGRLSSPVGGGE